MPKTGMTPLRKEQICRAAAHVIARRGLDRTTLREVARIAGVSTGSVNYYFRNKKALLLETVTFVSERFEGRCRRVLASKPKGRERLAAFIRTLIARSEENDEAWRVWLAAWSEASRSTAVREVVQYHRDLSHKLILEILSDMTEDESPDEDNIRLLAEEFDAYIDGWAMHGVTGERELPAKRAEESLIYLVETQLRPGVNSVWKS